MSKTKFIVEKSTESKNGGFVNTLRTASRKVKFGNTTSTTKGRRRYIKSDDELNEEMVDYVDKKTKELVVEINLDDFEETPIEGTYDDPETGEEREYTMIWLFAKGE